MDVSALRAEIKAWERLFRDQHGRDPSIQEIKDLPDIADKYKLYKKLSKQSSQSDRRSSPPRDNPRPSTSALLPKPRPVKTEPPSSTSNPFSPVRRKPAQQREQHDGPDALPIPSLLSSASRANPFTTPTKPKPRGQRRAPVPPIHELDEDPFPLILQPSQDKSTQRSTSPHHKPQPPTASLFTDATEHPPPPIAAAKDKDAVSRARKRLRGEPVSPSPVKQKRPRVAEKVATSLSFDQVDSSDEDSRALRGRDTFIDDTPAKPPVGKKQFKVLFDEAVPSASQPLAVNTRSKEPATGLTRSKSTNGKGLFGFGFASVKEGSTKDPSRSKSKAGSLSPIHSEDDMDWKASNEPKSSSAKLKAPDFSPSVSRSTTNDKVAKNGARIPKAMIPGKDDLWEVREAAKADSSSSKKRALSPTASNPQKSASQTTPKAALSSLPLLPPSPPPADAQSRPRYADKAKAKALMRKKTKVLEEEESEEESEETEVKVKEVSRPWERQHSRSRVDVPGSESQADSESEFDLGMYRPSVPPELSRAQDDLDPSDRQERFEVNLPEDLRRVLALSPPPHVAPDPEEEEKLVRGLLYGRREGHYDPSRGGEIWGVGEISGESEGEDALGLGKEKPRGRDESEDEWEGEPVPWEVGEL